MANAVIKLFIAGLVVVMPAGAESAAKIRVCVNSGNGIPLQVSFGAKTLTTRMFATAGVRLAWHSAGAAECRGLQNADAVILDFVAHSPASQHPEALAYAQVYEATHIVVLFDRVEGAASRSNQVSGILAHVLTHEIAHVLEGIARHSETGVMKAHWSTEDFDLMGRHPLPFAPEDIELIQRGLVWRAVRSPSAAHMPATFASR
jgi:hypothetical protein